MDKDRNNQFSQKRVEMNNSQPSKTSATSVVISLIIGLVLGFAFGSYWYNVRPASQDAISTKEDTDKTVMTDDVMEGDEVMNDDAEGANESVVMIATDNTASISTSDQTAGEFVGVSEVTVSNTSWVAVREDDMGALGNILGAKRLEAGAHVSVVVELLRNTEFDKTYHLVVYRDDGDLEFNHKKDALIERDGQALVATFKTFAQ